MKLKILLIVIVYSSFSTKTNACTCLPISVTENIRNSDLIFIGKVLKVDTVDVVLEYFIRNKMATEDSICCYSSDHLVTLLSKRIFKGKLESDTIYILTGQGGGDCGQHFKLNTDYIIYARMEDHYMLNLDAKPKITKQKFYSTTSCDRTTDAIKKEKKLLKSALKSKT